MKSPFFLIAVLGLVLAGMANDALTGLPLYPGVSGASPMPASKICQSTFEGDFYSVPDDAKMDAVMPWYTKQLAGFTRYHTNDSGGSQDTFFNPAGTLEVTVTGMPTDPNGVYGISYGRFTPAFSAVEMKTFLSGQKCH